MKSKFKIGLSAVVPITTIGAVAPLVTACSKSSIINHVHQSKIDALYGLNANTYKQLKKDYESKLSNSMISQGIQKDSKLWSSKMSQLQTAFNIFDNKANTTSMSYATLTSSLMKYARVTDKLQLRRVTNTKWSDINALFQGAYDSFDLFMTHEHFSESRKTQILNDATAQFNVKLAELESEGYKENDPFGAVQEIRLNLINFFDGVNDKICYLSSHMRLSDFNSKYAIEYKTLTDSSSYKSVWLEASNSVGKIISEDLFNKLFNLVDYSTGNIVQFQPALLIPGYTLRPKLVSCSADEKSNKFTIEIDLGLIKTSYLNSNDEATINRMTVHSVKLNKNWGIVDKTGEIDKAVEENKDLSNDSDFFDFTSKLPIKTDSYNLWNQLNEENKSIKDIYFNKSKPEYIRFRWPEASSKDAAFDPFINKIPFESVTKTTYVGLAELSRAGLEMSQDGNTWYPVWKVILSDINKMTQNAMNCARDEFQLKNTLMEDFVHNCDLKSEAKYIESGSSYEIQHKFCVTFKQSSSLKTLEDVYIVEDEFIKGKCENYRISQHEFIEASTNYSQISRSVAEFSKDNSGIRKISDYVTLWIMGFVLLEFFIAVFMTALGIRCFHEPNSNDVIAIVTGATGFGACAHAQILLGKMGRKVDDFLERAAEVNNAAATINLNNKLKEYSNIFVEVDEQGNYDKNDANVKNSLFQGKTFKNQWKTVSYLTALFEKGHDGYAFKQLVINKNVGPTEVRDLKDMFSTNNANFNLVLSDSGYAVAAIVELGEALAHDPDKNKIDNNSDSATTKKDDATVKTEGNLKSKNVGDSPEVAEAISTSKNKNEKIKEIEYKNPIGPKTREETYYDLKDEVEIEIKGIHEDQFVELIGQDKKVAISEEQLNNIQRVLDNFETYQIDCDQLSIYQRDWPLEQKRDWWKRMHNFSYVGTQGEKLIDLESMKMTIELNLKYQKRYEQMYDMHELMKKWNETIRDYVSTYTSDPFWSINVFQIIFEI